MLKQNSQPQNESLSRKIHRHRGAILIVSIPMLLISFVLFMMPSAHTPNDGVLLTNHRRLSTNNVLQNRYAVIFDAGRSGSRAQVFCFDQNLDLVPIGRGFDVFMQVKPGLNAHAANPKEAAYSLVPLLNYAENLVPQDMHHNTPVMVGVTAGLGQLGGNASERIMQSVKEFLKVRSSLKTDDDWVTVLDGNQEGSYLWVAINYLLKNIGNDYPDTVGVVDLGGGSVQMAYAISEADAARAPTVAQGEDPYVKEMFLMGTKYYLYVHSYLNYGSFAARAKILGVAKGADNPCMLAGYNGVYRYGGIEYKVSAPSSGSNMNKCKEEVLKALKVNESTCTYMKCTFGGVWNGGGGDGRKHLFASSDFFDRAAMAGLINESKPFAKVRPQDFLVAARRACQTTLQDAKSTYPNVDSDNLPYICMDLVYQYTLLVDGFGLQPWKDITLVKQIKYQDSLVEVAWPLGNAIEAVSLDNAIEAE